MAALHPEAAPSSSSDELVVNKSVVTGLKRKRDETNLVLCFAGDSNPAADPVLYRFQSHPIQRFITKSDTRLKLEPVSQFLWEEELDYEYKKLLYSPLHIHWLQLQKQKPPRTLSPPYPDMNFINAGDLIYVVGGRRYSEDLDMHIDLPTDFFRIHLSPSLQNSRVELETLTQMPTRNFIGGIAEIRGRIYVISSPYHPYHHQMQKQQHLFEVSVHPYHHQMQRQQHLFEVYDPSNNGWTSLPEPPFLPATYSKNPRSNFKWTKLTCLVMNAKLYVSSCHYSSIYDPDLNAWEACTIFPADRFFFDPIPYCGPPFPFSDKPVVFKEKFWVVPTRATDHPIKAYHISTDAKKKANGIKFECEGFPFGYIQNPLVDLGDDCFLAMVYECSSLCDWGDADDDTVFDHYNLSAVTFKLIEETQGDDSASILKATIMSVHKINPSISLDFKEEKEGGEGAVWSKLMRLSLVSAFLQHSNN